MYKETKPLIENTRFEQRIDDKTGKVLSYRIYPCEGFKLHEITLDEPIFDEVTMEETGEVKKGYTKSFVTADINYDFKENPREIYAEAELSEHEVM